MRVKEALPQIVFPQSGKQKTRFDLPVSFNVLYSLIESSFGNF